MRRLALSSALAKLTLLACGGIPLLGCGGTAPPPARATAETARPAPSAPAARSKEPLPANALRRSAVREVLAAGPGAFLQRLAVDDQPEFLGGKFHGFRIAALRGDGWRGVDLRPGDVVTSVNGFPIEHPEDAAEAFYSLKVASELRVQYERDGVPRELRFTIVDDDVAPVDAGPRRN